MAYGSAAAGPGVGSGRDADYSHRPDIPEAAPGPLNGLIPRAGVVGIPGLFASNLTASRDYPFSGSDLLSAARPRIFRYYY